jgi:trimethylamine--corrinoid protein Co-methyltransferase
MEDRAETQYKSWLAAYEPPALDESIDEALKDFMETKKASMPDAFS